MLADYSFRAQDLRFSTNRHGFASLTAFIPVRRSEAFQFYERPGLPHIGVNWNGTHVWEGRLEDIAITEDGFGITALGYWRGYSDSVFTSSALGTTTASAIVASLISNISTLNSFMSGASALVQDQNISIQEVYEDRVHSEILERLEVLGDDQTPPRIWEAGVWEDRLLHFRPRSSASRGWVVDAAAITIERTIDTLRNSAYVVYQDAANQRVVTSTCTNNESVSRYGLTRRIAVPVQTSTSALADTLRSAFLQDFKDPPPRSQIVIGTPYVYDQFSMRWPLFMVRAHDTMTVRNLPPTLGADLDRVRSFRIIETTYNADNNTLSVIPEGFMPSILTKAFVFKPGPPDEFELSSKPPLDLEDEIASGRTRNRPPPIPT